MYVAGLSVIYTTWQSCDLVAPLVFIKDLKKVGDIRRPSIQFTEKTENVCWLLATLRHFVRAEVWRVELTGVRDPNDVVEVAIQQKDSWHNDDLANISDFQKSLSGFFFL